MAMRAGANSSVSGKCVPLLPFAGSLPLISTGNMYRYLRRRQAAYLDPDQQIHTSYSSFLGTYRFILPRHISNVIDSRKRSNHHRNSKRIHSTLNYIVR